MGSRGQGDGDTVGHNLLWTGHFASGFICIISFDLPYGVGAIIRPALMTRKQVQRD